MAKSLSSPVAADTSYAYNTTTEELIAMFPTSREEGKQSSKCVVYALAGFVTLFAVWFVFASIVLRVGDPEILLRSPRLMHSTNNPVHRVASSSSSSSSSFNATMIGRVSLTNPNFGRFYYGKSTVSVLYGTSSVGAWELEGARLEARENKEINFMVHMRFGAKLLKNGNLTNDIHSGMLKLRSYAKLSGTVHVLKMVKKTKTIVMACIINLDFTSYTIHHFYC